MTSKDLGLVTAYAYAVSQGYTGTEEEFAELMASYATVAEDAAESAAEAAASATAAGTSEAHAASSAASAGQSATSAGNSATSASGSAVQAQSSATAAGQSATQAAGSATAAGNSATAAAGSASQAAASETAAGASATAAAGSATSAASSATAAAGSAAEADASADRAQEILDSIPEDYSELSEDVADLKSALNYVDGNIVPGGYTSINGLYINATTGNIAAATGTSDLYLLVFPCKAGTKYRIKKQTSTIMRASSGAVATPASGTTGHLLGAHTAASSAEIVGTTGASDTYLYVQLYANADPANMRSVDVNIKTLIIYEDSVGELLDTMTEQGAQWEV